MHWGLSFSFMRLLPLMLFGCLLFLGMNSYQVLHTLNFSWMHAPLFAEEQTDGGDKAQKKEIEARAKEFDLLNMSTEEFQLLTTLIEQSKKQQREEQDLDLEKRKLNAIKVELAKMLEDMADLEKKLVAVYKDQAATQEEHLKQIVKMFESMKPQAAAPIFSAMEPKVLLSILKQMKGNKTAAILAQLPPEKAAKITEVMTYVAEGRELT